MQRSESNSVMTITDAIRLAARLHQGRVAFSDDRREVTFEKLDSVTLALSLWLKGRGARTNDRVGVFLPRSVPAVLAYLGAIRCGLGVFPISASIVGQENHPAMALLTPRFVFCEDSQAELVSRWARGHSGPCDVVLNSHWDGLPAEGKSDNAEEQVLLPDDIVYYNMTSGTSGMPKFAATSHRNLIRNTEAVQSVFRAGPEDVYLCLFPIDLHPHEHFMRTVITGCKTVLVESRHPRLILDMIGRHQVTWLKAAPVMLDLLSAFNLRRASGPVRMRCVEISGATNEEQIARWRQCFRGMMCRVWGSTETTGIAFSCCEEALSDHAQLGRVLAGYRAEVRDADGVRVADGETGRLMVGGEALFAGYLADSNGGLAGRESEWHDTGDLACRDSLKNFHFRGRGGGILKVSGRKVFVGAVENMLKNIKGIREAAVVRAADRKREDMAVAFVALEDGISLTEQDILKSCYQQRSAGLAPSRVFVMRRLPLTPGGKTDYARLTEQLESRLE